MAGSAEYTAVLDANVLSPALLRDVLLSLADGDLHSAEWFEDQCHQWVGGAPPRVYQHPRPPAHSRHQHAHAQPGLPRPTARVHRSPPSLCKASFLPLARSSHKQVDLARFVMADDTDEPTPLPASDESFNAACGMLRDHLRRHPRAADTAHGIERWWIGDAAAALPPGTLERALEQLVAEGLLRTRKVPSGETLWYASEP